MKSIYQIINKLDVEKFFINHGQSTYNLLPSINDVIDTLARVGEYWQEDHSFYLTNKLNLRRDQFSEVKLLPQLLKKEDLVLRVEKEFGALKYLDDFTKDLYGDDKFYAPLGHVLHITAGNTILGAIDSLIMGLLTRNFNILKVGEKHCNVMLLLLESFALADKENILGSYFHFVKFPGKDIEIQKMFKRKVDAIIAWGGEDMANAWGKDLPFSTKFLLHGPKIGFQIITKDFFDRNPLIVKKSIDDIITYEQQACANSQNLFYEKGIDEKDLIDLFRNYSKDVNERIHISDNEYVELEKDYENGLYEEFVSGRTPYRDKKFQVTFGNKLLSPSSLNRSLICREFGNIEELISMLGHFSPYLQTVAIGAEGTMKKQLRKALALIGVTRFTYPGEMLLARPGAPHDGSHNLIDLTRVCMQEKAFSQETFIHSLDAKYYESFKGMKFEDIPLCNGEKIIEESLAKSSQLIDTTLFGNGEVYGTGGTTGAPKFCYYTDSEFKLVGKMLGESYLNLGLTKGAKVGNLFMAGNLWSSFNAIQEALKFCDVIQFPFGGSIDPEVFKTTADSFGIECLFGLPGLLVKLSEQTKGLKIKQVFYAGEMLSDSMRETLRKNWCVEEFYSAGYASVDVGPIAYQDLTCKGSEHILFSELIYLEVINGEAVVTSKVRQAMPVIRYRTGDRVEILEDGEKIKFKLLGRVDNKINIWSSRLAENNFVESFNALYPGRDFQFQISETEMGETLGIASDMSVDLDALALKIIENSQDLKDTHSFSYIRERLNLLQVTDIIRNERTGKRKVIIDLRKY